MTVTASDVFGSGGHGPRRLLELIGLVVLTLLADYLAGREPVGARTLPLQRVG